MKLRGLKSQFKKGRSSSIPKTHSTELHICGASLPGSPGWHCLVKHLATFINFTSMGSFKVSVLVVLSPSCTFEPLSNLFFYKIPMPETHSRSMESDYLFIYLFIFLVYLGTEPKGTHTFNAPQAILPSILCFIACCVRCPSRHCLAKDSSMSQGMFSSPHLWRRRLRFRKIKKFSRSRYRG